MDFSLAQVIGLFVLIGLSYGAGSGDFDTQSFGLEDIPDENMAAENQGCNLLKEDFRNRSIIKESESFGEDVDIVYSPGDRSLDLAGGELDISLTCRTGENKGENPDYSYCDLGDNPFFVAEYVVTGENNGIKESNELHAEQLVLDEEGDYQTLKCSPLK